MSDPPASTAGSQPKDVPTAGHVIHWANNYDRAMSLLTLGRETKVRQRMLDAAGLQPGLRVLDVGCGTGTLVLAAADRVGPSGQAIGIDPSAEMIARARHKAVGRSNVRFETAAIEQLPFEDGAFDAVVSSLMFHHLPAPLQRVGLEELRRVLRPGGRLTIIDFPGRGPAFHRLIGRVLLRGHGSGHGGHGHGHAGHPHDLQRVADLATELGFEAVRIEPFRPRFLRVLSARLPARPA